MKALPGETLAALLADITARLAPLSDTPHLDASVLLAHLVGKPRTWVLAHPEAALTAEQRAALESALARLARGEALPHVLGRWEFYGLDLELTPEVLIPRPETELLVERAIRWLRRSPRRRLVADVGTGCGCIAVAVAMNVPAAHIIATDISLAALNVAARNVRKYGLARRVDLVQCDLLPPHPEPLPTASRFDLICANLPYIPTRTLRRLPVYRRAPSAALNGGADGLDLIRRLLHIAPQWLAPGGMILLEIEASQGLAALSLVYDAFEHARVSLHQDLAGHDRLVRIELL